MCVFYEKTKLTAHTCRNSQHWKAFRARLSECSLSAGTSAATFIPLADFLTFSSYFLPSAVFFYSSRSGLIYLPGNFATTYHQGCFFTPMLQNSCRNAMTVTQQIPTANSLTFVFLPFLGLFLFYFSPAISRYDSHATNLRIQRVASKQTGNRK